MALREKIFITGPSGAGKSTLLKALANSGEKRDFLLVDLDEAIEANHGVEQGKLGTLIENVGWETFRQWENQILRKWMAQEDKMVIALGAGALSPQMWEELKGEKNMIFCFLKISFEASWERLLLNQDNPRPLMKRGKEKVYEIFLERKKIWDQIPWHLDARESIEDLTKKFWEKINYPTK